MINKKPLTQEQEQKLLILSEVFQVKVEELYELVDKFEKIPVDDIAEFVLDDPDFNNILKRSVV